MSDSLQLNQVSVTVMAEKIAAELLRELGFNKKIEKKGNLRLITFDNESDAEAFLLLLLDY